MAHDHHVHAANDWTEVREQDYGSFDCDSEKRGEICMEKLTPRIISLPWDLLRSEMITRQEPISDEVIREIIDDIFLPLVHERADNIE